MSRLPGPNDIVIAVMGVTGVGKSTFINFFSDEVVPVGDDLESCTAKIGVYRCVVPGIAESVFLVDTPGFDDTNRSDADVLDQLAKHLAQAWYSKIKLAGLIYLHRISEPRFSGASGRNLRMFQKLCGDENLASVVLATTFWKTPSTEIEEQREMQLQTDANKWKRMIDKGSRVMRQDGQAESGTAIIKYLIGRRERVVLDIQYEMVNQNKTTAQTAAGTEVLAELAQLKLKHEAELKKLRDDMREAIEARDHHWEEEIRKLRAIEVDAIARDEKAKGKLRRRWNDFWTGAKDAGEDFIWEMEERYDDSQCSIM